MPGCSAARLCSSTTSNCPACCTQPSCAAMSPTPVSAPSTLRRRARGRASSRSIPPPISARTGLRGRCSCRRRRSPTSRSISAPKCRWRRTRCATSASRWPSSWRTAVILRRMRSPTSASNSIRCPRLSISKRRSTTRARACTRTCAAISPPMCGKTAATTPPPVHAPTIWSPAASITTTAPRRRSKPAASSPIGTAAPISSPYGTPPRRRSFSATGLPECWA